MADFSKPITTDQYATLLQELRDIHTTLALMFNGTTDTNIPNGAIRWNATNNQFEMYDSSAGTWGALAAKYAIAISGNADTATTAANADKVVNKTPTATPTANAIPIADSAGKLDSWITGNGLGVGQTWQNVTSSRFFNTTYTNNTGRTIAVSVYVVNSTRVYIDVTVDGNLIIRESTTDSSTAFLTAVFIVPNGSTYKVYWSPNPPNNYGWYELR